ncbi:hypothetical protein IFM89_002008 [Coptis chinensis]|uniref:Peptidase M48 domain-containing protein n=1 Tax=Coptis chinensis TaxID=261450 RepID=A0A835HKZ6_9MAGN|nr:hypothetical protein IFM89_002008 [Coptis chinensis]
MSTMMQKRLGDFMLEEYKIKYKGKLLDEKDPHSVRAKLILKNIIQGLERQVKCNPNSNVSGHYYDGFNWNMLVVDDFIMDAHCIPGGTIFICVGMLQALTDGEVAAVISHEVGHIVARHTVEIPHPNLNRCKRELEADYIGLLLMASAGYNPRMAVELLKNISLSTPDCSKGDHEHQFVEERANSLAQAHVMEQALTIYKEDIFKVKDEVYKLWLKVYKWGCDTSYGWEMKCLKCGAFCLPGEQILEFTGLLHAGITLSFQHGVTQTVTRHATRRIQEID